jgi:GTP-binding protein HflX
MQAVDEVLEEIGAGDRPRLLVFNKLDLLDDEERTALLVGSDAIGVSAATGEGLEALEERIAATFEETLRDIELLVPYDQGARLSELHGLAGDLEREDRAEGVLVRARVPAALAHRFADLSVNGAHP